MSTWREIAGKDCDRCGGYATHYHHGKPVCCNCHGVGCISQKIAKKEHERVLLERDDLFHKKLDKKLNSFFEKNT